MEVQLLRAAANGFIALQEGVTTIRDRGARNEVIFPYDAAVVDEIVRNDIWVNPGQAFAYEAISTPDPGKRFARNLAPLRGLLEDDRKMMEAGARLVTGTMPARTSRHLGGMPSPRSCSPSGFMSPIQALEACTSRAAEAIGLEKEVGGLKPGMAADLVAVDGDPETDVRALERVRMTVLGGEILLGGQGTSPAG